MNSKTRRDEQDSQAPRALTAALIRHKTVIGLKRVLNAVAYYKVKIRYKKENKKPLKI